MFCSTLLLASLLTQAVPDPAPASTRAGVAWVENRGQWPFEAEFVANHGSQALRLGRDGIDLQLRTGPRSGALVRFAFEGPSPNLQLEGLELRPEHYGFFFGRDPDRWQRAVPAYDAVACREVWEGVDLVAGWVDGAPKYDVVIESGAGLEAAVFAVEGAQGLSVDADGSLNLQTAVGPVRQPRPVSFELDADDRRYPVDVDFVILPGNRFGFTAERKDLGRRLVIDPGLLWSGYLGSSSFASSGDRLVDVDLGPDGESVVVGIVDWGDFPITPGAYTVPEFLVTESVSVTVINDSGTGLEYSCLLGAVEPDIDIARPAAVRVGSDRSVFVVGNTHSSTFPVTPGAFDTVSDAFSTGGFLFKLTPDGSDLEYSTLLETEVNGTILYSLALTAQDHAIVGGMTSGVDFPLTPGVLDTFPGPDGGGGTLTQFSFDGSELDWSTYLGAGGRVLDIEVGPDDFIYTTGRTGSLFPTTAGSYDPSHNNGGDAFVAKIAPDASSILWATYLGGLFTDFGTDIAVDINGDVVVAGETQSLDFPTTPGAPQPDRYPGVSYDLFVSRISSDGSTLIGSTFLGGSASEVMGGLALDAGGVVTLAGAGGNDYPVTPGAYKLDDENFEGLVTRLAPDLSRIFYSSLVGENDSDRFWGMAMDESGVLTAVGYTNSVWDHPPDSFGPDYVGGQLDGIVVRFDPRPAGVEAYGTSTPSCHGPLVASVTEQPVAGSDTFSFYVSGAPPESAGVLALGTVGVNSGLPLANLLVFLDPASAPKLYPVTSGPTPYAELPLPIPPTAAGLRVFAQFVFAGTDECGGFGTLSASNALAIVVQ
jgi:hypothetical protein